MKPKGKDNSIIRLKKKREPDPENNYRPEILGRNKMKVTQLTASRLPRILNGSPEEEEKGDLDGNEQTKKGRHAALSEAKADEIEVAAGCLFGSRLNAPSWERMRNSRSSEPARSEPGKGECKTPPRKSNRPGADQAAPG